MGSRSWMADSCCRVRCGGRWGPHGVLGRARERLRRGELGPKLKLHHTALPVLVPPRSSNSISRKCTLGCGDLLGFVNAEEAIVEAIDKRSESTSKFVSGVPDWAVAECFHPSLREFLLSGDAEVAAAMRPD